MLYITDTNDVRVNGVTLAYQQVGSSGSTVTVVGRIVETDQTLIGRYLTATLQWNDGNGSAISFGTVSLDTLPSGYWAVSASKSLMPGQYVVALRAQNYRSPKQDEARLNFFVTVTASKPVYTPAGLIYGPILPRDSGFPNAQQWAFNMDSDLLILESSVKMLLVTSKGDRLMEPDYGTNLRRLLFGANLKSTASLVQQEIVMALAAWEPRVTLSVSKLNDQPFETSVQFNR
jgi:phage baseplate assembly protein W